MTHFQAVSTTPTDGVVLWWYAPYAYNRATRKMELDGTPHVGRVGYFPWEGDDLLITGVDEGSILDILLSAKYDPPTDDMVYDAIEVNA